MTATIITDNCITAMRAMPEASVDAIVTDPPYNLTTGKRGGTGTANGTGGFMGKAWDRTGVAFDPTTWREALRVLKPGGHLLAFGGTRTYHRLTCAIEDAGFEIRDCIAWMYGQGFPKSHNLNGDWQGWGTALKPAFEPIVVARKPLVGTVAANVLAHGTGALNVDGCRVESGADHREKCESVIGLDSNRNGAAYGEWKGTRASSWSPAGRWPANVVLDPEAAALLDAHTGELTSGNLLPGHKQGQGGYGGGGVIQGSYGGDAGGASRFYYVAKASSAERNAGLEGFPERGTTADGYGSIQTPTLDRAAPRENWTPHPVRNTHPTVKPIALMQWLVRLITPPQGHILDPFNGSGTTGIAAILEGMHYTGIEREAEYAAIARARIAWHQTQIAEEARAEIQLGLY